MLGIEFRTFLFLWLCAVMPTSAFARPSQFGETLCQESGFTCHTVIKDESWASLWPDETEQDIVRRVNRLNINLRPDMIIAVPDKLEKKSIMDFSPFQKTYESNGSKIIVVDLKLLAWGAYDENGDLVKWGPTSGGKGWCPDIGGACATPAGEYYVLRKAGAKCKSHKFPVPNGGAPMPYCMFFKGGYAIHGSRDLPGYNASHGCARVLTEDARWLNEEFVTLSKEENDGQITRVVILP